MAKRLEIPEPLREWLTENEDRSLTLRLETPLKNGSETVSELRMVRPKGKHLRDFDRNVTTSQVLDFAGRLSGTSRGVMDEMDCDDTIRLGEAVGLFFGPTAGANS